MRVVWLVRKCSLLPTKTTIVQPGPGLHYKSNAISTLTIILSGGEVKQTTVSLAQEQVHPLRLPQS